MRVTFIGSPSTTFDRNTNSLQQMHSISFGITTQRSHEHQEVSTRRLSLLERAEKSFSSSSDSLKTSSLSSSPEENSGSN